MIKLKNLLNELNISKDDMEKLHKDGEVEVDGQKITFKSETEVNEGYSTEEKRIVMMAVRKIAKYMNRDLKTALGYVIGAATELQRSGKVT